MPTPTYTLIASSTVGSGGTNFIDFTSISSSYTDLVLKLSCRVTPTGSVQDVGIRFNSDTGANYTYRELVGTGASVSTGAASGNSNHNTIGNPSNSTASTFSNVEIYIPNYASSNQKSSSVDAVVENNTVSTNVQMRFHAWLWSGTAAISTIRVYDPTGGNLLQYSSACLYGIVKS